MVAIAPVTHTNLAKNYDNIMEIDIKGHKSLDDINEAEFATLASGISTMTPSAQETAETNYFWDGRGNGESETNAKVIQYAIAGKRSIGDPAQDYVDDRFMMVGDALKTLARITDYNTGKTIFAVVTLTAIVGFGGNANASGTFSTTVKVEGMPWLVMPDANVITLNDESTVEFPGKGLPFNENLDRKTTGKGGTTPKTPTNG